MNKIFTKIFSALLAFVLICPVNTAFTAFADEAETAADVQDVQTEDNDIAQIDTTLLKAWGILDGTELGDSAAESLATPANITAVFNNLNAAAPTFDGDIVRQNAFAEAVVNMLGYGVWAKQNGGWKDTATKLGLFKGIDVATAEAANSAYIVQMLYNALDCKMLVYDKGDFANPSYKKSAGTYLEEVLNIYNDSGLLEANGEYALDAANEQKEGNVLIDSVTYVNDGANVDDLLGCYIDFYYKKASRSEKAHLLYARSDKDGKMLVIDSNDILSYSGKEYTYYAGNKTKTARFKADSVVIYNTIPVSKYTDAMMKPESGTVVLTDGNGDGAYDIVSIMSYTYIMAGAIDKYKKIIHDKDDATKQFEYDNEDRFVLPDGTPATIDSIKVDAVLSVAYNDKKSTIIICDNKLKGTVDYTTDDAICVNGTEYKYVTGYTGEKAEPDDYVELYLTHNSEIYYSHLTDPDTVCGFVMEQLMSKNGLTDTYSIKLCTMSGEIQGFVVSKKATVDGIKCTTTDQVQKLLTDASGKIKRQVILYRLNEKEEINWIDTPYNSRTNMDAKPGPEEDENSLRVTYTSYHTGYTKQAVAYWLDNKLILSGKAIVSNKATYFNVPNDDDIDDAPEDDFSTTSIKDVEHNKLWAIETYSTGDTLLGTIALSKRKASKSVVGGNYAAIVTDVGEIYSERYENTMQCIKVLRAGNEYKLIADRNQLFPTDRDENELCKIRRGDIIRVNSTAYTGDKVKVGMVLARIEDGKPIYTSASARKNSLKNEEIGDFNYDNQSIFAHAIRRDGDVIYLQPEQTMDDQNTDAYMNVITKDQTSIYICPLSPDSKYDEITVGTADDIITQEQSETGYSKMFVFTSWCTLHMLVIYK